MQVRGDSVRFHNAQLRHQQAILRVLLLVVCGRPNRPHYASCPSVRPSGLSVWPVRPSKSKTKRRRKTKIAV